MEAAVLSEYPAASIFVPFFNEKPELRQHLPIKI